MMHTPYIGITDFTKFEQVESMLSIFRAHRGRKRTRRLHVGVMMSYKTLHNVETKWARAFPPKEDIADIFKSGETMNCLHYADYDSVDVFYSLCEAIRCGGTRMNALQLDMIWPDPDCVAHAVHSSQRNLEIILQIGKDAMELANDNPQEVVERLRDYQGIVRRVLLDKSMGRGREMDAVRLIPFVRAIYENFSSIGVGVAGGLGPETMELVKPLLDEFPSISIDAQGKLRPSGNALDPIDWSMARTYLIRALEMME